MIRAENLGRRFGDFVALEGLDLEIAQGEVFGLLGPNGAGKTTTVRLLTAVISPTTGRATVAGFDVATHPEQVRANVGILTETPGIYVRLDAVENLRFFADIHGLRDPDARIRAVLERLDLWARRKEPVGGWSKGMRQRLAIARAVLHEPKVVFLDEPTSALDPAAARTVRELVTDLRREGRTIILCTHNLDEAERLCDRIGVLRTRLLRVDTPARLCRDLERASTIVRLVAPDAALLDVARALPFVRDAALAGDTMRIALDDPEAHNPALVRALVEAGAEIRTVSEEVRTLEQVYLELVGASPEARA
ncbi:ABC transporter ATP-binding protein [Sandaracinus amylolyticus]|uniref:ABC transporter ATP-binding protein n=1 Tax=Sandaracinus amylolyticus TaxID=927083 RepID=UPI001F165644|nr:ABC transporter ATP-binding protein [Sandaracinus amylolyticus]UJR79356.1 Daunorubicin resistance ABC transporter ATP-binding subunit [Sandaracinus amylolyticus]